MSGKLKMTDKIGGGSTTESDSTENSKSKKRCESSMGKVDPKNVKITVPSSERDGIRTTTELTKPVRQFDCRTEYRTVWLIPSWSVHS